MRTIPSRYYPRIIFSVGLLVVGGMMWPFVNDENRRVLEMTVPPFVILLTLGLGLIEVLYALSGFTEHRKCSRASTAGAMLIAAALAVYGYSSGAGHAGIMARINAVFMLLALVMTPLLHVEHNRRVTGTERASVPAGLRLRPAAGWRPLIKAMLPRLGWYLAACAVLVWIGETTIARVYPLLSAACVTAAWLLRRGEGIEPVRRVPRQPRLVMYGLAATIGVCLLAIPLVLEFGGRDPQLRLLAKVLALFAGELLLGWHEARAGAQSAWVTSLKSGSSG